MILQGLGKAEHQPDLFRIPKPEPSKLIIELTNLGEGHLRTVKRELKVLIEDFAWKRMISGCIQVRDEEE